MRAKYESKHERFHRLKQLDAVIKETADECKVSKIQVADYLHHFLKWQQQAFNEMLSPSYSWYGFGYIQAIPAYLRKWDTLKEENKLKHEAYNKQKQLAKIKTTKDEQNEQTNEDSPTQCE